VITKPAQIRAPISLLPIQLVFLIPLPGAMVAVVIQLWEPVSGVRLHTEVGKRLVPGCGTQVDVFELGVVFILFWVVVSREGKG
jgi:hypothetical protein